MPRAAQPYTCIVATYPTYVSVREAKQGLDYPPTPAPGLRTMCRGCTSFPKIR